MRLIVDISDDPRSGFKRKVEVLENTHFYKNEGSNTGLKLLVTYYDSEGNSIEKDPFININKRFNPFTVDLLADNKMVNPETGEFAKKEYFDEPENKGKRTAAPNENTKSFKYEDGSIREYDYFAAFTPAQLGLTSDTSIIDIMNAVYTATILKKDSEGRFN